MARFGDYIVYVDESGDHSLVTVNAEFPLFVLAFCLFPVDEYIDRVVPAIERLKFDHFGHDMVILHEREIRKSMPPFDFLLRPAARERFFNGIERIILDSKFGVIACVIDKRDFLKRRGTSANPYHVALEYGLERVFYQLQERGQVGRTTHVVFESRGRVEDAALELEFRRIQASTRVRGLAQTLEFRCAPKSANSSGLQLADMIARPIGIHVLRPGQPNRAWEVIVNKIVRSPDGERMLGFGLKTYP